MIWENALALSISSQSYEQQFIPNLMQYNWSLACAFFRSGKNTHDPNLQQLSHQ
jgi:hypothetical protein